MTHVCISSKGQQQAPNDSTCTARHPREHAEGKVGLPKHLCQLEYSPQRTSKALENPTAWSRALRSWSTRFPRERKPPPKRPAALSEIRRDAPSCSCSPRIAQKPPASTPARVRCSQTEELSSTNRLCPQNNSQIEAVSLEDLPVIRLSLTGQLLGLTFYRTPSTVTQPSTKKPPPSPLAEVPEIVKLEPSRSVLRGAKIKMNAGETTQAATRAKSIANHARSFAKELQQQRASLLHFLRFAAQAQVACMEAAPFLRTRPLHLQHRMPNIQAEFRCTSAKLTCGSKRSRYICCTLPPRFVRGTILETT